MSKLFPVYGHTSEKTIEQIAADLTPELTSGTVRRRKSRYQATAFFLQKLFAAIDLSTITLEEYVQILSLSFHRLCGANDKCKPDRPITKEELKALGFQSYRSSDEDDFYFEDQENNAVIEVQFYDEIRVLFHGKRVSVHSLDELIELMRLLKMVN